VKTAFKSLVFAALALTLMALAPCVLAVDEEEAAIRERIQKVLDTEPNNPAALLEQGTLECRVRNFPAALKPLTRVTQLTPEDPKAWLALGEAACEGGKLDLALAALSRAVLLDPKNARAHSYLGVTVGRKGWMDGAEAELQRALELDDSLAEAHFNLAVVYLRATPPMVELARRHYRRARDLGAPPDSLVEKQLSESKQ